VAGTTSRSIKKYNLDTLELVASTPVQTGTIYALAITDSYIYAGGDEGVLYMYNKATLSIVA